MGERLSVQDVHGEPDSATHHDAVNAEQGPQMAVTDAHLIG
jgi:hypothetical protein